MRWGKKRSHESKTTDIHNSQLLLEQKQPNSTIYIEKYRKVGKDVSDLDLNPRILIFVGDPYGAATGTTSTKFTRIMKTLILAAEKRPVFLKERHPTLSSWPPRTSPKSASHGCLDTQVLILCLSEFHDRSHSFTQIAQLNGIQCISRPICSAVRTWFLQVFSIIHSKLLMDLSVRRSISDATMMATSTDKPE